MRQTPPPESMTDTPPVGLPPDGRPHRMTAQDPHNQVLEVPFVVDGR